MAISLQKHKGIELRRRRQSFYANASPYTSTSSSQVRIEINVDKECIDFETGYLMFDLSGTKAADTNLLYTNKWDASAWIRDLRVYDRAGREIGEQVRHYNAFARKHFEMLGNDGCNSSDGYLGRMEGADGITGDETTVPETAVQTAQERAHKFITHIFDIKSYFPAHLMGGLIIEIDMADTRDVLHTVTDETEALTSYVLDNVRYVCDLVLLKPDAEASLRGQLQNGLEIHYESPMTHSQAISASGTQQRFDLGVASGKIKYIQAFQILDSLLDIDEDSFGGFTQNGLEGYRMKLGSEWLTEREVKIGLATGGGNGRNVEYVVEFLKSMNLESSDVVNFYGDSALTLATKFVIGQKVEVSKDPDVSSGRRDFQSNKVELELNFGSGGATAAATLYTNIMLEKNLVLLPGRQFKNVD